MKKKVFGITLLLVIFTFAFAHGEELIDEEVLMAEPEVAEEGVEFIKPQDLVEEVENLEEVEELAEVEEIQELKEEVEEIIEEVEETLEIQEEIIDNEYLEEAMDQAIELEKYEENTFEKIEDYYNIGKEKAIKATGIIENQYNKKKKFVQNTKEVYVVTRDIEQGLKDITYEMGNIIKDEDRKIDKETYGEIRDNTKELKKEVRENKYMVIEVVRESKNYVVQIKNKEIRNAVKTFDKILILQEEQLRTLYEINGNVNEIKVILENA